MTYDLFEKHYKWKYLQTVQQPLRQTIAAPAISQRTKLSLLQPKCPSAASA